MSDTNPVDISNDQHAVRRNKLAEMRAGGFDPFRASVTQSHFSADAIERALAHQDPDPVRRAYHRGAYWTERVEMAVWWADFLDKLKIGGDVVPLRAADRLAAEP